ncbi:MAG: hypothetical protein E7299_10085 [Lachnospiraceae bacterium]|nr:hypothetical protein [Lachnospiraceae bacterium]
MTKEKCTNNTPNHSTSSLSESNTLSEAELSLRNPQAADNSSKLIFKDPELCAQFLRDYINIPILKNVQACDIEDITERFEPLFTAECDSDTVKRIHVPDIGHLYLISLIEHKTKVDYNVSMQLLKYMYFIWDNYEKEQKKLDNSCKNKGFRYPPILPIVYYEGKDEWKELLEVKDRIYMSDMFEKYIPNFSYELVNLTQYTFDQILEHKNVFSIIAALNKTQSIEDFKVLPDISEWADELMNRTPEHLRELLAKIVALLMSTYNYETEEIRYAVEQIKEEKMARLWEHAQVCDIQEERRKARTEGRAEGRAEGRIEQEIETVCKLLKKGMTIKEIVDLLDKDEAQISSISKIVEKHAPDYDISKICEEYLAK